MADDQQTPPMALARAAAGVLFFDEQDRIMLVHPTYKDYLDIPGGYVEPGETPHQAAAREVREELGIDVTVGRLLIVDWAPIPTEGDKILFVFDGGQLTPTQLAAISFTDNELSSYTFHTPEELPTLLIPRLTRRLTEAISIRAGSCSIYLEHGLPIDRGRSSN